MSLRVRLVLLILVVVALAAVALSAVELETLVDLLTSDALERSSLTGQQVSALLQDHIERYSENYPTPQSLEETKALWNQIVSDDAQFHRLLVQDDGVLRAPCWRSMSPEKTASSWLPPTLPPCGPRCSGARISKPGERPRGTAARWIC